MSEALLALAEDLARRAGDVAREGRARGMRVVGTKLTDTDMVTVFDREAEATIVAGLREARPDDSIVGEEVAPGPAMELRSGDELADEIQAFLRDQD